MKVLVTGATGFVGSTLVSSLIERDSIVVAVVRKPSKLLPENIKQFVLGDLEDLKKDQQKQLTIALIGVDIIVHAAARVHVMNDEVPDSLAHFRRVNTASTLNLAHQAAEAGVKRFVYLSSIKVNGESTVPGERFTPSDSFVPADPYALSKYEAEQGLLALAAETNMDVVIIRSPLVYGPGVKANFASMLSWVEKGVPLPFGAIHNKRSLIALHNLVSFIMHCSDHPKAANEIFLISDDEDVSTTELLRKVSKAFGNKPMLLPFPVFLMKFVARILDKGEVADRLFGSLQVDSSKARDLLGWKPVISMDDELKKTADAYLMYMSES